MVELLLVVALGVMASVIEHIRSFNSVFDSDSGGTTRALYGCFNVHLPLSIGASALVWKSVLSSGSNVGSSSVNMSVIIVTFFLILFGSVMKGLVSDAEPEGLGFSDKVATRGMYIPNAVAVSAVVFAFFWI